MTKSKATTGVKNTASYISWLYTTWDQIVASNMIHCILVLMAATQAQVFCDDDDDDDELFLWYGWPTKGI